MCDSNHNVALQSRIMLNGYTVCRGRDLLRYEDNSVKLRKRNINFTRQTVWEKIAIYNRNIWHKESLGLP